MLSFLAPAWGFLKAFPREVWYVAAAVLFLLWFSSNRYEAGWDAYDQKLRAAQAEAQAKADLAAASADEEEQARAADFQAEQDALEAVIEEAGREDRNALDGIF